MTVQRFASSAEADRHDLVYWQAIPVEDRIELVWQLSLEQWQLATGKPYEPGRHRSVVTIHRREGPSPA
ncbi:MAG TPA: hypothetical protein VIY56_09850 [Vicinamibacterales bacterium]